MMKSLMTSSFGVRVELWFQVVCDGSQPARLRDSQPCPTFLAIFKVYTWET